MFAKVHRMDCPSQGIRRGFRLDLGSIRVQPYTPYTPQRTDLIFYTILENSFFKMFSLFGAKLVRNLFLRIYLESTISPTSSSFLHFLQELIKVFFGE